MYAYRLTPQCYLNDLTHFYVMKNFSQGSNIPYKSVTVLKQFQYANITSIQKFSSRVGTIVDDKQY